MSMDAEVPHDDVAELAHDVVRAECLFDRLAAQRRELRAGGLLLATVILLPIALLLPWSYDDGYLHDGFAHAWPLPLAAVATVASTVVAAGRYWLAPEPRWRRVVVRSAQTGAVLCLLVGGVVLALRKPRLDDYAVRWAGPGLFLAAALAVVLLAARLGRDPGRPDPASRIEIDAQVADGGTPALRAELADEVHRRTGSRAGRPISLVLLPAAGLALVLAGLVAPWQRLDGPAVAALAQSRPLVWTGIELTETSALRWACAGAVVVLGLLAAIRPARAAVPAVEVSAGVVVITLVAQRLGELSVAGLNASLSADTGPWITLAGGIVLLISGFIEVAWWARSGPRRALGPPAAAALTGCLLLLAMLPIAAPGAGAAEGRGPLILAGGDGSTRLGGAASAIDADHVDLSFSFEETYRRDVVTAVDGTGVWVLGDVHDGTAVIYQQVSGRALPVTVLAGADDMDLLEVVGHTAVIAAHDLGNTTWVALVDLRQPSVRLDERLVAPQAPDRARTVLTTAPRGIGSAVAAHTYVRFQAAPDGSIVVRVTQRLTTFHRISLDTIRTGRRWQLGPAIPGGDVAGATGANYDIDYTGVRRIPDDGSAADAVLGEVSDRRCTPSRDPLSTSLRDVVLPIEPYAVDRAGNLWVVMGTGRPYDLYVVTRDGVLRRAQAWHGAVAVWASGDGSLFVGTATADRSVVHTYRIRDAAAAAHSAVPLGPVAADCVSDNRVHPPTEQRRPRPYPAGPFDLPLDARGSVLRSTLHTVTVRRGPSGSFATVHRSTATIGNAAADGTGGAWWSEQRNSRFSLWHLDSRDRATAVVADLPAAGRFAGDEIAANPADGSCWWRAGSSTWLRTDRSGHTRVTHYAGRAPVFGGGAGFALGDTDGTIRRVSVAGAGPAVLGGNRAALWLPSAVTSQATPPDYSVDGSFAVTSRGELLLLQRGWLARFGSAGRVTLLAGPSDGIPADGQLSTVVGNRVVILPDNPGARAYAVGVS